MSATNLLDEDELPEISQTAYDKLDRWIAVIESAALQDKRTNFVAAVTDVWTAAEWPLRLWRHLGCRSRTSARTAVYAGGD
jgi:hypothetical protein